jgi:GNAT superfamily N-acetyltransferase
MLGILVPFSHCDCHIYTALVLSLLPKLGYKSISMISIRKATIQDCDAIAHIGKISVEDSHRGSSSKEDMNDFLDRNYNTDAIKVELNDIHNIYYMLYYRDKPVGFSKTVLNANHPNIAQGNVTKLDRIYLLKEFYGLKLGLELLNFNIELARNQNQSGMWLYAWIGNARAVNFYQKAGFSIIGSYQYYVTETHYDESHHMFLNFADASRAR